MSDHTLEIRTDRRVTDNRQAPYLVEFFVEKVVDFEPGNGLFVKEIRDPNNKDGDKFIRTASIVDVFNVAGTRQKALLQGDSLYRTNYVSRQYEDSAEAKERTAQIEKTLNKTVEDYRSLTDNWLKDNPETLEYPLSEGKVVSSLVDDYRDIVRDLEAKKIERAVIEGRQELVANLRGATNLSGSVSSVVDEVISDVQDGASNTFLSDIDAVLSTAISALEGVKSLLTDDSGEISYRNGTIIPAITEAESTKDSLNSDFDNFLSNGPVRSALETTLSGIVNQLNKYENNLSDKKLTLDDKISQLESDKSDKLADIQAIDPTFEPGDIALDPLNISINPLLG